MTQEEFNIVFELQMRKCADILAHKKKEYTGDNIDRLSAFKIAVKMLGNLIEIRSDLSIFTDQFSEVVHVCNNFNLVIDLLFKQEFSQIF